MDHFCKCFSYWKANLNDIHLYVRDPQKQWKEQGRAKMLILQIFEKQSICLYWQVPLKHWDFKHQ